MQRENKREMEDLNLKLMGKMIFFATGNIHKFNEARDILSQHGMATSMLKVKGIEIQSDHLCEIATTSAINAFKQCHLPLIVEDAGFFIDALNGFPGPYAAYAYHTIGNAGILKLMGNVENRRATFKSVITYCDSESNRPLCFKGDVMGEIALREQIGNNSAFGFDPIFIPSGHQKTFAQMGISEKNVYSHRAIAVNKFAQWYKKHL